MHRAIGQPKCVAALLETKPDKKLIDAKDKRGCTAFLLCCASGHAKAATMLLDAGCSITACDKRKRTGLMLAASAGKL